MEFTSTSEEETGRIAGELAGNLKAGDVLCLRGTLGMGKSVFARALIRALMGEPKLEVPSPTFTLVQTYDGGVAPIYHYDLYRLEDEEEIFELGWDDALAEGIVIIEWPDRAGAYLPRDRRDIEFSGSGTQRRITITHTGRAS